MNEADASDKTSQSIQTCENRPSLNAIFHMFSSLIYFRVVHGVSYSEAVTNSISVPRMIAAYLPASTCVHNHTLYI